MTNLVLRIGLSILTKFKTEPQTDDYTCKKVNAHDPLGGLLHNLVFING